VIADEHANHVANRLLEAGRFTAKQAQIAIAQPERHSVWLGISCLAGHSIE
jgi:hypothetical protein